MAGTDLSTIDAIQDLTQILRADAVEALDRLRNNPKDSDKRSFVRAMFAYIEGAVWAMKQSYAFVMREKCSQQEISFLNEEDFKLEHNGTIKQQRSRISLLPNIRFAFKTFAKTSNSHFEPDYGGKEFQTLARCVELRDRLTHPKSTADLKISDEELTDA